MPPEKCRLLQKIHLHVCMWQPLLSKATYATFKIFYQFLLFLGINPMTFVLSVPCFTVWATGRNITCSFINIYLTAFYVQYLFRIMEQSHSLYFKSTFPYPVISWCIFKIIYRQYSQILNNHNCVKLCDKLCTFIWVHTLCTWEKSRRYRLSQIPVEKKLCQHLLPGGRIDRSITLEKRWTF